MNPVVEEGLTDKKDVEAAEDEAELVLAAASPRTVTRDRAKVGMVAWIRISSCTLWTPTAELESSRDVAFLHAETAIDDSDH